MISTRLQWIVVLIVVASAAAQDLPNELKQADVPVINLPDTCFDGKYCFLVKRALTSRSLTSDACCKTIGYYYAPKSFNESGVIWLPFNFFGVTNQWVKVEQCLSNYTDCTSLTWPPQALNTCEQKYEWHGFLVYRLNPFQVQYKYFELPDYCACVCESGPPTPFTIPVSGFNGTFPFK